MRVQKYLNAWCFFIQMGMATSLLVLHPLTSLILDALYLGFQLRYLLSQNLMWLLFSRFKGFAEKGVYGLMCPPE